METPPFPLSSRPERTRISCHVELDKAACAALRKESRMNFVNTINLNRKSGVAQRRDLQFSGPPVEMFFPRVQRSNLRLAEEVSSPSVGRRTMGTPRSTTTAERSTAFDLKAFRIGVNSRFSSCLFPPSLDAMLASVGPCLQDWRKLHRTSHCGCTKVTVCPF